MQGGGEDKVRSEAIFEDHFKEDKHYKEKRRSRLRNAQSRGFAVLALASMQAFS